MFRVLGVGFRGYQYHDELVDSTLNIVTASASEHSGVSVSWSWFGSALKAWNSTSWYCPGCEIRV